MDMEKFERFTVDVGRRGVVRGLFGLLTGVAAAVPFLGDEAEAAKKGKKGRKVNAKQKARKGKQRKAQQRRKSQRAQTVPSGGSCPDRYSPKGCPHSGGDPQWTCKAVESGTGCGVDAPNHPQGAVQVGCDNSTPYCYCQADTCVVNGQTFEKHDRVDVCAPVKCSDICVPACTGGKVCKDGACKCPTGKKKCGDICIPDGQCCEDGDCPGDKVCKDGECKCPYGQKPCGNQCIPDGQCCEDGDCPGDKVCKDGQCKCPYGQKPCGNQCIPDGQCCDDCDYGQHCCGDGQCKECCNNNDCGGQYGVICQYGRCVDDGTGSSAPPPDTGQNYTKNCKASCQRKCMQSLKSKQLRGAKLRNTCKRRCAQNCRK